MTIRSLSISVTFRRISLRDAQSGSVAGRQDGAMLDALHAAQKLQDLFGTQDNRQLLRLLGRRDDFFQAPILMKRDFVEETKSGYGEGQAQHLARQVGHGALGQDKEPAVVSHQAQPTVALSSAPSDPSIAMLEVLGWSAEDQQSKPLTLGIGGHVVEAFAYRFEASQIVMLIEQLIETLQFGALHKSHLDLV